MLLCRFPVVTALGALYLFSAMGCGSGKESSAHAKTDPEAAKPVSTATAHAASGTVTLGPDAPELKQMTIEAVRTINIPADEVVAPAKIEVNPNRVGHAVLPVPGRIVRVMVKLGDSVSEGQPVVAIESPTATEAEENWVQADIAVRQSEVNIAKAEADLARLADLLEHKAVAQKEVLAAQTGLSLAKASKQQAQSSRDQARRRLELLGLKPGGQQQTIQVVAPVSGKVLDVNVVSGEFRNELSQPLITIADLSRVWATSEVPESKIRHCKVGGAAALELIAYPGDTFRARVTRIADTVNSETRTIKVSAELENPGGRLRPEMFGTLRYDDGTVSQPWVPESAIVRIGEKDYVFQEQQTGTFLASPVTLGRHYKSGFTVDQGLKGGERVVTQGAIHLKAAL